MKNQLYLLFIFCILLIASCAVDDQCRSNRFVLMELGVYHVTYNDTTKIRTTVVRSGDSLTVKALKKDSITGKVIYLDSILYNNLKVNKLNLPLHKFENESMYEITFNTIKDTLTIVHENTDDYLSLECGCIKIHSIDTAFITKHFADSIQIINHKVNNVKAENIKIFK